jgi:hypothetical protein
MVRDMTVAGAVLNELPFNIPKPAPMQESTRGSLVSDVLNSQVGRKVTDRFYSLKTAVGSGINDIVQSIVPLLDGSPEENDFRPKQDGIDAFYVYNNQNEGNNASTLSSVSRPMMVSPGPKRNPLAVVRKKVQDPLVADAIHPSETVDNESNTTGDSPPSITTTSSPVQKEINVQPETPPTVSVGEENIEVDPLTGLTLSQQSKPPSSSPVPAKRASFTSPAATTGKLRGEGTGYGNLTAHDSLPMSTASSTPVPSDRKGMSLFGPNWFPSSSAKSVTKKQKDRLSVGVGLQTLGHDDVEFSTENTDERDSLTSSKEGSTALRAKGNAIKDRLLEIADHLCVLSAAGQHTTPDDRDDVCIATARRLTALASVLSGDATIVDFDRKFANKELPMSFPAHRVRRDSRASMSGIDAVGLSAVTDINEAINSHQPSQVSDIDSVIQVDNN